MQLLRLLLSSLFLFGFLVLSAQSDTSDETVDSTGTTRVFGAIDGYWRYGFNQTIATTSPALYHNEFTIGWLSFGVEHTWKGGGMRGDLSFGQRTFEFLKDENDILTYVRNLSVFHEIGDQWVAEFGIFPSYIGYEYDDPWRNPVYSPSYVYSWTPVGFLGVRGVYSPNDVWAFTFGVYNSSNGRLDDNVQKHLDINIEYDTDDLYTEFSLTAGREDDGAYKAHFDIIGDYKGFDKFNIGYNYYRLLYRDAGAIDEGFWQDFVLYLTHSPTDQLDITLRYDHMHDPEGFIYGLENLNINAFTLSPRFSFGRVRVYPEIRWDFSDQPLFFDADGVANTDEGSFLVGVAYLFE